MDPSGIGREQSLNAVAQLNGNKCRVHTRHGAHGSVCVAAVVLPAGVKSRFGRCGLSRFVGGAGPLDEQILRGREYQGDVTCPYGTMAARTSAVPPVRLFLYEIDRQPCTKLTVCSYSILDRAS